MTDRSRSQIPGRAFGKLDRRDSRDDSVTRAKRVGPQSTRFVTAREPRARGRVVALPRGDGYLNFDVFVSHPLPPGRGSGTGSLLGWGGLLQAALILSGPLIEPEQKG